MIGNVMKPNGESSGGGLNYSDVEHVVGTWTENGVTKTLYERTLVSTYVQYGSAVRGTLQLTGITNISYLKDIGTFLGVRVSDTTYKDALIPVIYYHPGNGCVILDSYLVGDNKDQYLGNRVSCVVRYTKS